MTPIKFTITLLAMSFSTLISAQSNCREKIQEGTFISLKTGYEDYYIVRKKNKQIEYFNQDQSKIISKVKWLDDETYKIIIKKRVNFDVPDDTIKSYTFKVIECEGEKHSLETIFKGQTIVLRFEEIYLD